MINTVVLNANRSTKIDFIYRCLKKGDGKGFTKKQLNGASDEAINSTCERFAEQFEKFINNLPQKLTKYIAEVTEKSTNKELTIDGKFCSDTAFKEDLEKDGYVVVKIVPAKGHHICMYCGSIANGSDKNILCDNCTDTFGHYRYSDL